MTGDTQGANIAEGTPFGGDRQHLSPLEAVLIYGDQDVLKGIEARRQGRPPERVTVYDEDDGKEVQIDSVRLNADGLIVDYALLHHNLLVALRTPAASSQTAQDKRFRRVIGLCAEDLYDKLARGFLLASGIPSGERLHQPIASTEWNRQLRLDFSNQRAVLNGSIMYRSVKIRDPAFLLSDSTKRRGPKGRRIDRAFELYKELLANDVQMNTDTAWCAHLKKVLEERHPGEKWNEKTLQSSFPNWKRKLAAKK